MNDNTDAPEKTSVKIDREKYVETRTASGAKSLSNGDPVAILLAGLPIEALYAIADRAFKENDFKTRYQNLNIGMQRMNLGNRLRGFCSIREKENIKLVKDELPVKKEGLEAIEKWVIPYRKEADTVASEKAASKKAASEKAASKKAATVA